MAKFLLSHAVPPDPHRAASYVAEAASTRQAIFKANPGSAQLGQEFARTLFQLARAVAAAGDERQANAILGMLHAHLKEMEALGLDLADLRPIYDQLEAAAGG